MLESNSHGIIPVRISDHWFGTRFSEFSFLAAKTSKKQTYNLVTGEKAFLVVVLTVIGICCCFCHHNKRKERWSRYDDVRTRRNENLTFLIDRPIGNSPTTIHNSPQVSNINENNANSVSPTSLLNTPTEPLNFNVNSLPSTRSSTNSISQPAPNCKDLPPTYAECIQKNN